MKWFFLLFFKKDIFRKEDKTASNRSDIDVDKTDIEDVSKTSQKCVKRRLEIIIDIFSVRNLKECF